MALSIGQAGATPADQSIKKRARELVSWRSKVDALDAQLRAERVNALSNLKALSARERELTLLLDAEKVRIKALEGRLAKAKTQKQKQSALSGTLRAALERSIALLKKTVQKSLPYRLQERLAAIDELSRRLGSGRLDAESVAMKLWRLLEDEIRLTMLVEGGEVAVRLGDRKQQERLVHVVRIGMLTLFTHTQEGVFGRLIRDASGHWKHLPVVGKAELASVKALFRALHKQVREGAFVLPLAPAVGGGAR
jgi:hypothetical protein